jgi:hypothetical protein
MQRKQQVGECWVCVIFFICMQGGSYFYLDKCVTFFRVCLDFRVHCWAIFRHMVFADGFLFPVKELGC